VVQSEDFGFVLALILHKLPEGVLWAMAISALAPLSNRENRVRIMWVILLPALAMMAGSVLGLIIIGGWALSLQGVVMAFVAGALLYICFSELLPMLTIGKGSKWFVLGVLLMVVLQLVTQHSHTH
jgi:zinc transporter ZupT